MKKINTCSLTDDLNLSYNEYFILPYYDENTLVYITIKDTEVKWFNKNLKPITPYKRISKSLLYFYENSKFKGYEICILGFVNKIQKFQSLAVFDLLLKDEIDGKIQSKKYSIRYDNIKYRFLINIPKSIKNVYAVFGQKYSENAFNTTVISCIKSNIWEGFSLYKDKPFAYEDDQYDFLTNKVWETSQNKIKDVKFTIDKEDKITLNSIIIKENNIEVPITLGLEKIKVQNINDINELKDKNIMYKTCNIDDVIYSKFISFSK